VRWAVLSWLCWSVGCGASAAEAPRRPPPASATGLPESDLPPMCAALEACCVEDVASRACGEWPEAMAEAEVSRWTCTELGRRWLAEARHGRASAPPGCGPLLTRLDADARAPLAEEEVTCVEDDECTTVAAGRSGWCNFGGLVVASRIDVAPEVQARLDRLPLDSATTEALICPTALARCMEGACELEWDWTRCEHDAECVRMEHDGGLMNACRASSAARLSRALAQDGVRGEPSISSARVACVRGRCTLDEDRE
jgi:hypothetical protein